jgi:ribosomal protein L25 (general stress protein Ctc)
MVGNNNMMVVIRISHKVPAIVYANLTTVDFVAHQTRNFSKNLSLFHIRFVLTIRVLQRMVRCHC